MTSLQRVWWRYSLQPLFSLVQQLWLLKVQSWNTDMFGGVIGSNGQSSLKNLSTAFYKYPSTMTFLSCLIRNWEKKPKHFFVCHWTLHYAHQLVTNFVCHHSHLVQSLVEAMGVKQSKMKGWNGKANSWKTNSFREPAGSGENAPWVNHFMQCQSNYLQ